MKWFVLDTETAGDSTSSFRLGVLMDAAGDYVTFRTADGMRQAVEQLPPGSVVWGHNVSYDLLVLWRGEVGAWFVSGRFRRAQLRGVQFRDTLSYFEMPLAEAARMVDGAKLEGDATTFADDGTLEARCVGDCELTRRLVVRIHDVARRIGVPPDATGPGSWARSYWKMRTPWIDHYPDDLALRDVIPEGLMRGGLVKFDAGSIHDGEKWDVKSAYPWQMIAPAGFPDLERLRYGTGAGRSVLLRWRDESGRIVWGPPEEAEAGGHRPMRNRLYTPQRGRWSSPFRGFVAGLMGLRNTYKGRKDAAGDYLTKRVLNSLSGCLGARTAPLYVRAGVATGGKRLRALPGTRSVWASLITGRQRARLLRAWAVADSPVYSDTDSLVCRHFEGDSEGSNACGRWVLEETFEEAWILGPKMYATLAGNRVKSAHVKGIPKRMAAAAIAAYREGGETVLEWDSVATYREAHNLPGLWLKRHRDPFSKLRG